MNKRLAWVGIAVLAGYAVFIGGAWFGIYYPALRLLSMLSITVVLVLWGFAMARDPSWQPRSVLSAPIIVCLASLAISTAFSRRPGISLEYVAYAVVLAALYLLLVRLMASEFFRQRFVTLATALLIVLVVGHAGLTIEHWLRWLTTLGTITIPPLRPEYESLTFGTPSTVLTMAALLAVPAIASAAWSTRRGLALVVGLLVVIGFVALITGSRAGWLAMGLTVLAAAAVAAAQPTVRQVIRRARATRSRTAAAALVAGVGVAAVGVLAFGPAILSRLTAGGEGNRLTFVRVALEMFAESPIVGTGPGTWVIQRPAFTPAGQVDEYIPHAHNVYAQTMAELGVVGVVAGVILIAALARLVVGVALRDSTPARRRWAWVTLLALVYFAAHQVLDFYPNFPSVLFAAALPVAYLDATSPAQALPRRARPRATAALAGGAATIAAALLLLTLQEAPALLGQRGVDQANLGAWAAADAPAREAAALDPRVSSYVFTAGLTAAHAGDHAAALRFFERVTTTDDLPEAWLNLAAEQAATGDPEAALRSIDAALRLGGQRAAVSFPAGELALRLGNRPRAVAAFSAAILFAPSLAADPWWTEEPARQEALADVVSALIAQASPAITWELALMSGDQAKAKELALASGIDAAAVDFVDAWAGDEPAYQRLLRRCENDALNLNVLFWCARIEGRRGNVEAANNYRYLANAQIGGSYRAGAELRVATEPTVGRSLEGNPAIFWGTYTYRRSTPWDVLVPTLVHLTLE